MKISEYISNEKEKMKTKSLKERLAYFWDYYKWFVLIGLLAIFLVGHTVAARLNQKEAILNGILIDGMAPLEPPAVVQAFYDANGVDTEKQEMVLDTGLALNSGMPNVVANSYQVIHARIGAQEADFIMGYEYAIQRLAYDTSHVFSDLRDVFSAEDLAEWEGSIYYIDGGVLAQIGQSPMEEIPLPDPFKPEEMVDPVPIAVDITACTEFSSAYYSIDQNVYVSVVANAPHKEMTARLIELLRS